VEYEVEYDATNGKLKGGAFEEGFGGLREGENAAVDSVGDVTSKAGAKVTPLECAEWDCFSLEFGEGTTAAEESSAKVVVCRKGDGGDDGDDDEESGREDGGNEDGGGDAGGGEEGGGVRDEGSGEGEGAGAAGIDRSGGGGGEESGGGGGEGCTTNG